MTTTRERLAQLEQADFDSFGEQDPAANGTVDTPLTPDEWVDIRAEINERRHDDHTLAGDLLAEALRVLGDLGMGREPQAARTAAQCLRRMVYRAHNGVPFGEPVEPSWSLDKASTWQGRNISDAVEDL